MSATMEPLKLCRGCSEYKATLEFGRHRGRTDGLRPRCKICTRSDGKEYHARNSAASNARSQRWRDSNRQRVNTYAEEYRALHTQAVKDSQAVSRRNNPERTKAKDARYNANRYAKNPEKIKEDARAWKRANPDKVSAYNATRRAKKMGSAGRYSAADIAAIRLRQKDKCAHSWCRTPLFGIFHRDHIMPLSLGGSNAKKNIQLLCKACNLKKHARHPVDFAMMNGCLV